MAARMIGLISIPVPSSTLYLTKEEAQRLLESLEIALPHSVHFEIAGEVLSGEEVMALLRELRTEIRKQEPKKMIPWEREGF